MKNLLAENKFQLLSIATIFLLFMASLFVRDSELKADLSAEQEWVSAHILITNQVWDEGGGPSNYHFSPVYTYEGDGNKNIPCFGGVVDENGDQYYVSYPPLAFLFSYYSTKLLGGSSVYSLRAVSVILHFFCCLLLYLTFKKLQNQKGDFVSIAGLTAVALYLFSAGTLWMHSILFFSDMLVQLFIIWMLYLTVRIYKSEPSESKYFWIQLSLIVFLASYTEWLAVFLSFTLGIGFLISHFKTKKKKFRTAFLLIGISSVISVSTTIIQYSSIAGFEKFKNVSLNKYDERSGHQNAEVSAAGFNLENPDSFELLNKNLTRNFWMIENILAIVAIVFVLFLLWKKTRKEIKAIQLKVILLAAIVVAIFMHYYLFFNFNALHNFSNLKIGFLFIFIFSLIILTMEEAITLKWKIILSVGIFFLLALKIPIEVDRFHAFCEENYYADYYKKSANFMKENCPKDSYAFTNLPYTLAEYIYRAEHIPFRIKDTSEVNFFMNYFEAERAQYYHHDKIELVYVLDLEMENGQYKVIKKTNL